MRKPEQLLWDSMRPKLPPSVWAQRVENISVDGMPDTYLAFPGGFQIWCELKAVDRPVRDGTRFLGLKGLNVDQVNWQLKACHTGIRCCTLIRDQNKDLYLVPGQLAVELNAMSWREVRAVSQGPDWGAVVGQLMAERDWFLNGERS